MHRQGLKLCPKCDEQKAKDAYYKDKRRADGLYSCCKTCHGEYTKGWSKKNPEKIAGRMRDFWRNHPEVNRAYSVVYKALKSGRLIKRPCKVCGNKKVEAHHEDYSKPLEVEWLCRKHHTELHRIGERV